MCYVVDCLTRTLNVKKKLPFWRENLSLKGFLALAKTKRPFFAPDIFMVLSMRHCTVGIIKVVQFVLSKSDICNFAYKVGIFAVISLSIIYKYFHVLPQIFHTQKSKVQV